MFFAFITLTYFLKIMKCKNYGKQNCKEMYFYLSDALRRIISFVI